MRSPSTLCPRPASSTCVPRTSCAPGRPAQNVFPESRAGCALSRPAQNVFPKQVAPGSAPAQNAFPERVTGRNPTQGTERSGQCTDSCIFYKELQAFQCSVLFSSLLNTVLSCFDLHTFSIPPPLCDKKTSRQKLLNEKIQFLPLCKNLNINAGRLK